MTTSRTHGGMDRPRRVAAVDFGTHGTGFAWAVLDDHNAARQSPDLLLNTVAVTAGAVPQDPDMSAPRR
jgi:hypothetical protein